MPDKKGRAQSTKSKLKMRREPFYQMEKSGNDWLDRLIRFNQHFGRFARDGVGVILLAIAIMILLGLMKISQGSALKFVTDQLSYWLGWGSYLAAFSVGLAGFAILRWDEETISFGRFIAVELVLLLTLSLLAVMGNNYRRRIGSKSCAGGEEED